MFKDFSTISDLLKKNKFRYIWGITFLVVTSAGQLFMPQFVKQAVDTIASGLFSIEDILTPLFFLLGTALIVSISRFLWRFFIQGASRRIEEGIRGKIYNKLLTLDETFFNTYKTGDLMARSTNDIQSVRMATGMAFVAFTDGLFMTTVILVILFSQNPGLAGWIIAPLPVITLIIIFAGTLLMQRFRAVQQGFSKLSDLAQEFFSSVSNLKSMAREEYAETLFVKANREYQDANMSLVKLWGLFFPLVFFLGGMTNLLLLYFGGHEVMNANLSPGDFIATLSYLGMLIWPMLGAGFTVNLIQRGRTSMKRINEILNHDPRVKSPEYPQELEISDMPDIEIKNLSFSYNEENVLKDINLTIKAGQKIGILGSTGSGKTSLLKQLPRILNTPENSIFINGTDIAGLKLEELRSYFSYVPQDHFLFSQTIKENILFSNPDAPESLLESATDASGLARDLPILPDGIKTQIGERGVSLSGGQKQRASLARGILSTSPVLLLDDPLSAVDLETENFILSRIFDFNPKQSILLISNRTSTLSKCDYIYVLDKGEIIQHGTHQSLMQEEGMYSEIHNLQQP